MGWRDFKLDNPPVHYVQKVHLVQKDQKEPSLIVQNVLNVEGEALDIFSPDIKQNPQPDLLTEVELEAFNGWYASCRKPEFGMNHEEATLKSWELLIESMVALYRREEKERYASGNKRNTENGEN
jgi:hypothetical protein